jgi:uncharacterized protein YigA (DUF484 family)
MNDDDVERFLLENPDFFDAHPELLSQIRFPNPHGGQAIALSDRQVQALREENKALKTKLHELVQFGEENDAISTRMHQLMLGVLASATMPELLAALHIGLREGMTVPHTALRIWGGRPYSGEGAEREEFSAVGTELKEYAAGLSRPFCGPSGRPEAMEAATWFGEAASHVRSVAHMPLHDAQGTCIGMLALGSEDVLRFYPDMGVLYLQRLAELTGAALRRFV